MAIHIGKRIKDELYRQGISVSAFAKKINRSRNIVYDIFERESIDTALLNKIAMVLRLDFFSIYSEQKEYKREGVKPLVVKEDKAGYTSINEKIKMLEKQIELLQSESAYQKKIIMLLEEKKKPAIKKAKK